MEDVTGQRHVDEQLARHASLLENVEDAVVTIDRESLIAGWNQGAARMYGWSLEEVLGKPASFVRNDLSEQQRAEIRREIVERGRWRGEATVKRKDGSTVTVEVICVAIRDTKGLSGYLGIHRDVTERKRAEDALRQAQLGTEAVLESTGDLFIAMDSEWRITYMNQRALTNSRRARGEDLVLDDLLGRNYSEVFPQTVGTAIDREFHRAARDQETVAFEVVGPLSGVWFDVRAYPTDHGLSVYSREITERKEAEERVVEAREAERTRIARALHDEALQGLADAIALVALAEKLPSEQRLAGQLSPVLQRVGQQLRRAIYDLRLGTEHRPFVELVEQLVGEHQAMAGDSEVDVHMGDGVPTGSLGLTGVELLRILGEALTNARRHADARHVRVRMWGATERLWTEVSDDGLGFDTTSPASPLHHGMRGMHERAGRVGGHLQIDSEPGVGTTVRLEVNLTDAQTADA